ncbi:MYPU_1760 family metalloprotease [Mycoplasmopsis columboralis]|uniref:Peptidase M1 membrane alanine aminopeptidase domain-containing protein n=1 Tax=Mycoplasmopsis columboralis TaxID=171282 RepID=A0A449B6Q8_9BACT|nr:hypothetical protein [Mycoplasmopsis columboralis]VEU76269.1 Uncharacterised protein [Mycoplasmopsis columboralis]
MKKTFKKYFGLFAILSSLATLTSSCDFFDLNSQQNPTPVHKTFDAVDLSSVKINKNYQNFDDSSISPHRVVQITDSELLIVNGPNLSKEQKNKILSAVNSTDKDFLLVKEKQDSEKRFYLEYIDPYTKIIFRDYAYFVDGNNNKRYLLGKNALVKFAQEFKRKVPFGPEVFYLEAININDFNVIPKSANGAYIPQSKNIYLNGFAFLEKNISLYSIMSSLMGTLFHEYIHHWANTYAQTALIIDPFNNNKNDFGNEKIIYHGASEEGELNETQLWNGYFSKEFKNLLNWNINIKADLTGNSNYDLLSDIAKSKLLHNYFSPNELWEYANTNVDKFHFDDKKEFWYTSDGTFVINPKSLQYIFSLTELVAREYTKFAFENYYPLNDGIYPESSNSTSYFGWFGNSVVSKQGYTLSTYGAGNDWMRTYLLNSATAYTNRGFDINEYLAFPDNVFAFNYKGTVTGDDNFDSSSIYTLKDEFKNNRSSKFYELFLDTMGYGKAIAQIFPKIQWKWNDKIDDNTKLHESIWTDDVAKEYVKFSGYLPNKKYSGFVIVSKDNKILQSTKFQYQDTFNFFGKSEFDTGAIMLNDQERQKQLQSRIYPNPKEVYYPYITEDYVKLHDGDSIYFWIDDNKNNIIEENEIKYNDHISLPEFRRVSNAHSTTTRIVKTTYLEPKENKILVKQI